MTDPAGKIDVVFRMPEEVDGHHHDHEHDLPFPCSRVVAEATDRPQQQNRNHEVIQA